ncbi:hypothetical protein D9M68_1003830 [compost metagenome]
MDEQLRLDRQSGSLATLEGAFTLLVAHLAKAGALNKTAFIADLHQLSELPGRDVDIQRAEQRLIRMLEI